VALFSQMEDAMSKNLEANDKPEQDQRSQPRSDKPNPQKLQGEALKINQNTVEGKERARSPAKPK